MRALNIESMRVTRDVSKPSGALKPHVACVEGRGGLRARREAGSGERDRGACIGVQGRGHDCAGVQVGGRARGGAAL